MSAKVDEIVSIEPLGRSRARSVSNGAISSHVQALAESSFNAGELAKEQIRGLVQRVFFPGWPLPAHQVVFSAVDAQTDTAVCADIAHAMAVQLPGTVCAFEADEQFSGMEQQLSKSAVQDPEVQRTDSVCIGQNLWLLKSESAVIRADDDQLGVRLRQRLSELRRSYDYMLVHAPPAYLSQTALLGQVADGIVLIVRAGVTHRAAAIQALRTLEAAKVNVLGTILTDRTFPIPEKLYRRL